MAVYAIGDIQGCYDPLRRLLDQLDFHPDKDRLWLTGDLVNRGPHSLKVLRFVRSLGSSAITVLGNHDLHLIAVANGIAHADDSGGSLEEVLDADDCDDLVDWLRARPLAHFSNKLNTLLVHAGLPPGWTVKKTLKRAAEVEAALQGHAYLDFVSRLYGNTPARWSGKLSGNKRLRFIVNCLTRIRMLDEDGRLDFAHKGPPGNARKGLVPWFDYPGARWRGTRIVFGHWSALGLVVNPDFISLDTGCVWNRELTAVRLSKRPRLLQVDCRRR
ncbi:MAG: symmetrical bis(5'-nucleosyl)-tetraphosphatase [Woeseiaceae bacterium]